MTKISELWRELPKLHFCSAGHFFKSIRLRAITIVAWAAMVPMVSQAALGDKTLTPTVTFTLDFPQSTPEHYSIAVDAAGHGRYECTGKITKDSDDEPYQADFEVSAASRVRIFDLTRQAKYFAGKIDSGNAKLAFTGTKTLSYQQSEKSNTARFNYSSLEPVRQLTALFQGMAETLEYGRRLAYYHRYQKLALDEELKRMEAQAKNNELREIQGVAPVLREIIEDDSVLNVVRARAQQLIGMANMNVDRR